MKHFISIFKENHKKYGFKVLREKPSYFEFERKKPVITKIIYHFQCGYCNIYLDANKCPKCNREYDISDIRNEKFIPAIWRS